MIRNRNTSYVPNQRLIQMLNSSHFAFGDMQRGGGLRLEGEHPPQDHISKAYHAGGIPTRESLTHL